EVIRWSGKTVTEGWAASRVDPPDSGCPTGLGRGDSERIGKDRRMRVDERPGGSRERHLRFHRRGLLRIGGLGSLGLTLPGLLRAEAEGSAARGSPRGRAEAAPVRSCILLFYYGGPSHVDTVDMKPDAPAQVRGEFGAIATSVPGLRVCE